MAYKLKEFEDKLPATLYALYLFKVELTKQDIYSIENTLERYNKKYPYISYLLAISNTDSDHCLQREIKKHTRGRPKTVVIGNKIPIHIHLSVLGNEEHSAYKYLKDVQKAINKRFNRKICSFYSKGKSDAAKNFINYSLKQASYIRKSGTFNEIIEKKDTVKSEYF